MEAMEVDGDGAEVGFTSAQLTMLKRQIQQTRVLTLRLKATANALLGLGPRPAAPAARGQAARRRAGGTQSDAEGESPAGSSEEEADVTSDDESDSEASELSDSSLSGGRPSGEQPTAPTRRMPRSVRQRAAAGRLKEPSFEISGGTDGDSDGAGEDAGGATSAGTRSPGKRRRKFVMVGSSGGEDGGENAAPVRLKALRPVAVSWGAADDEAVCSVCGDGDCTDENPILFCEGRGCSVAVHLRCYGVPHVPDGEWLCDVCASKPKSGKGSKTNPVCALCPVAGGAMRRVTEMGRVVPPGGEGAPAWAHLACVLWTPGVALQDGAAMARVDISGVTPERVALRCCLCDQAGGAAIQCSYGSCCRAFHVLCGRFGGHELGFTLDGSPLAFCTVHSRPRFLAVRQAMAEGKDAEEAIEVAAAAAAGASGDEGEGEGEDDEEEPQLNEYEMQRQRNLERIAEARRALLGQ